MQKFENRFQLVCSLIALAMGQKGAEIWARLLGLQPAIHSRTGSLSVITKTQSIYGQRLQTLRVSVFSVALR